MNEALQWNNFVAHGYAPSFLQSWEWGEMQRELDVPFWRLSLGGDTSPRAASLVLQRALPFGRNWLYAPRGPIVPSPGTAAEVWPELMQAWNNLAQEQHTLFVRCDPAWTASHASVLRNNGWRPAEREVQPRETLVLDLKHSPEELLAAMHQKTRYNIRVAAKHGVTVQLSQAVSDLEIFLQLCRDVEARSAFRYHPEAYYRAMHKTLAPAGMLTIAVARQGTQPLAAHLLISFAGTVTYAHGASSSREREAMAPHLLQWESITWAQAQGATRYDFFGIAPADAVAGHPWAGITRFKLGFGGERETYVGAHDYVHDTAGYTLFTLGRRLRRVML